MILRFVRLMLADLSGSSSADTGHAADGESRALVRSIRRVALAFAAIWQPVMASSAAGTLGLGGWGLMLACACLAGLALLALALGTLDPVIPLGMVAIGLWGYIASADIDSTLAFAACWQINFSSCVAGLLLLRPYAVPLVAGATVVIAAVIAGTLPHWGVAFALALMVTQISIIVVLKWGVARLVGVASEADTAAARAADAQRHAHLTEQVSAQMAEESRVLHDTAINTLGAIANGGAGIADPEQVRAQCARDVTLLQTLRTQPSVLTSGGLQDMFSVPGMPLRRSGADDSEVTRCERLLPPTTVTAIVGCVREAVNNVAKHSGADHAILDVLVSSTTLIVVVRDAGVGFAREAMPGGLGIGSSIMGRARDHGFHAEVTGVPGRGTTVTLTVPLQTESAASGQAAGSGALPQPNVLLHRHAGGLWAIGVTVVSVVLAAIGGTNHYLALYPMIGTMLLVWLVYQFAPTVRERLVFLIILAGGTCLVFFLSAAATEFGTSGAVHWQALAPTGPFVLLLSLTSHRGMRGTAAAFWAVVVVAVAAMTYSASGTGAQIVVVAGCVGLGFSGAWAMFEAILRRFVEQSSRSRREVFEANLRSELDAATQNGYRKWVGAGLDSAIDLLRDIAEGAREPDDAHTRYACAAEEEYLRQVVQISPRLINLSSELPHTLRLARDLNVSYILRLGGWDAPDQETARSIVSSITGALSGLRPGDTLRASLYPVDGGLQLTLVGSGVRPTEHRSARMRPERPGSFDVTEIVYSRDAMQARAARVSATTLERRSQ